MHRCARRAARRLNALRFMPEPVERIAECLQTAGYPHRDAPEPAEGLLRRADDVVWTAAGIGTPPHGAVTLDLDGFEKLAGVGSWDRRPLARLLSSLINAHIAAHRSCLGDPAFWTRALASLLRVGVPYVVVGDSHSLCSCVVAGSVRCPTIPIHVLCTAGSAAGLNNPASRSGYSIELTRFAEALRQTESGSAVPVLLQFGQVDVEFLSVFHRVTRSETRFDPTSFDVFCERTVDAYGSFLTGRFSRIGALHVASIFPPALADEAWTQGYTNAHVAQLEGDQGADEISAMVRSIEIPTLAERTTLHRSFNQRLEAMCRAKHLRFVDLFDRLIGRQGIIAPRFTRFSGGLDHHVDTVAARKAIRPVVQKIAKEYAINR